MTDRIDTDPSALVEQVAAPANVNRRRLLVGGGVAAMAAALAACSTGNSGGGATATTTTTTPPTSTSGGGDMTGDLAVAKLAAGLEVLAVNTYTAAGGAATAGKLGTVPPAVAEYVTTALAHHQTHLAEWNKVITGAGGGAEVTEPNATLKPTIDAEFAKVTDVAGVANLALMLEQIAAQTYLKAIPTLKNKAAIKLAGQIQIVDQQHQAILLYALGMYPVPEVFQTTDKAATG
ncbi:MAG: ferritin-like domain-containing protein [Actinomycetota bacterium]|nr:ferritin-like domain-containing protein [Actinomycetota bacterium]